jgi:hypothetical protein
MRIFIKSIDITSEKERIMALKLSAIKTKELI